MFIDYFTEDMVSTTVSRETTPPPVGGVIQAASWSDVGTPKGLKWDKAVARQFVGDQYVTAVDTYFVYAPGTDVAQNDRITQGSQVYTVEDTDNVGMAGEILLVPAKELPNGVV